MNDLLPTEFYIKKNYPIFSTSVCGEDDILYFKENKLRKNIFSTNYFLINI